MGPGVVEANAGQFGEEMPWRAAVPSKTVEKELIVSIALIEWQPTD